MLTQTIRLILFALFLLPSAAFAQGTLDVTFRFLPDLTAPEIEPVVRAFLPGSFNDWGPNTNGQISVGAPSQMTYLPAENEYRYTTSLQIGQDYFYKVHYHRNESGSEYEWITDPLADDPCTYGGFGSDCRVEVRDPMAFQLAREQNDAGQVVAVSAGLFGTSAFEEIEFQVGDGPLQDGLAFYDAATGIFRYELPTLAAAPGYLRLVATDALGRTVEAESGIVPPSVIDAARPEGLEDGITYVDDTTVRLSLFAPYKGFVHVVGDFNGWRADNASLLFRDAEGDPATADSVWWWTELSGLAPGEPAVFQYLVDGALRIADPYSALVLTGDDPFISEATFPDLPPYPAEAAGRPATLLRPGAEEYEWQVDDFERPAQEDLVVYELLVRDFLAAHAYDTLADTLDYLDRLGVNAIELMPVAEFGGNINWGYQPQFHLALDKYYGPPEQLKAFVDAAHARGIAVILDVVYNHADSPSPLVDLYGCTEASLYTNSPARHPFNVFCDLDHTNAAVQHWLDRANRWWIEEYRVDGFRFDLAGGFMQTGSFFGYNPQRIRLLQRMADEMWDVDDEAIIILENLIDSPAEFLDLAQYGQPERPGMMVWHTMHRAYSQSAMGYLDADSDLGDTYPPSWIAGMPLSGAVTYMESHDEQWMMFLNRTFGNSAGGYDVTDLGTALDRQKLAGTFFFPVPGARMMWQFGEVGYGGGPGECLKPGDGSNGDCLPSDPSRTGPKPIRWEYADDPARERLYQTWAALLGLRRDYALFTSPDTEVTIAAGPGDAARSITLTLDGAPEGEPSAAVIVGNFGLVARDIAQAFPSSGTWYEFFTDTEREVAGTNASVVLAPGFARIFTDVDVPSPELDIYTVEAEGGPATPLAFGLDAAYPNPFAETATIGYTLPAPGEVRVSVYDVLGRRVAVLADGPMPAGAHRAVLDGAGLPSGTYVVRLTAGARSATTRLTLLR